MEKEEIVNVEDNEKYDLNKVVKIIRESGTLIPADAVIGILSSMVFKTGKDSDAVKHYLECLERDQVTDDNEKISRIVTYTCNTIVISLWNLFGKEFKKFYLKNIEKMKAEVCDVEKKPQA